MDDGPQGDTASIIAPACETLDGDGINLRIFKSSRPPAAGCLELIGDAARLPHRGYDETDDRPWRAHCQIGSPSAWEHSGPASVRAGDGSASSSRSLESPPIAPAKVLAILISSRRAAAFVPEVHMLYGLTYSVSDGTTMVRFESQGDAEVSPVPLSKLVGAALEQGETDTVGVVLIGETAGLVGTALRRSPVAIADNGLDVFAPAQARDWLSLTSEPVHARSTALVVGVATRRATATLAPFVRPLSGSDPGELRGHFHAAVVPYRPLPRGSLELTPMVQLLFEPGRVENVLHLLDDWRPIVGAGESTFTRGVFWVVPLAPTMRMEAR